MTASHDDERKRLAFNAFSSGVSNVIRVAIQLALLPVLARLVGPEEFGVYAVAVPIISFFTVVADGGLGASLSRVDEGENNVWSTAFWLAIAMGVFIAACVVIVGVAIAFITNNVKAGEIISTLSLSFFILSFGILPNARLVRRGRLVIHNVADVLATVIGALLALGCAYSGYGAWSLVAQALISVTVRSLVLNMFAFRSPALVFEISSIRPHLASGGAMIGSKLSEFFGRILENLIISVWLGDAALGSFSFANQSSRYIVDLFGNTLWGSMYSFALRNDKITTLANYQRLARLLAVILFPVGFFTAACAPDLFVIFLGQKWQSSSQLFSVLLPFYVFYTVFSQVGAISYAYGKNHVILMSSLIYSIARLAGIVTVVPFGIYPVAWAIGLASLVYGSYMMSAQNDLMPSSISNSLKQLIASGLSAGLCSLAVLSTLKISLTPYLLLPAAMLVGCTSYVIALFLIDRGQTVRDLKRIFKVLRP